MPFACATCDREDGASSQLIPIVGMVCLDCFEILSQPTVLDGAVEGPSILTLARGTVREFERRRETIRKDAKTVCRNARKCGECGGSGAVDSGGQNPDGSWINVPCPLCGKAD